MLTLGPFAIGPDGSLAPRAPGLRPALRFAWRGRRCEAEMREDGLRLRARAGRIPSSAERDRSRRHAFATASALPPELPEGWTLRRTPDHHLEMEAEAPLSGTAVELVSEMVRFGFALDPWIDRLEAGGVASGGD